MIFGILTGIISSIVIPTVVISIRNNQKSKQRRRKESELYMVPIRRAFKSAANYIQTVTINPQSYAVNLKINDELITLCVVSDYEYEGEAYKTRIRKVNHKRFQLIDEHAIEVFELLADFHTQKLQEKLNEVIRPDRLIGNGTRKEELREVFDLYKEEIAKAVHKEQQKQEGLLSSKEVENLLETEFPRYDKHKEVRPRTAS